MNIIILLHDWSIIFIFRVAFVSLVILLCSYISNYFYRNLIDNEMLEFIWTWIPTSILILILAPSLLCLYVIDEFHEAQITVKAQGHQWYWQYDIPNVRNYNSFMNGGYRFLDTDNRLIIPVKFPAQMLITAADVLHSWALPTLGVKADAVPGRVNKQLLLCLRPGLYFGQCREICGRNHRFIPISLECTI